MAIVLLDVAIQSLNILHSTRLFAVAGDARSRVNAATVTTNFAAGAIGSAAAGLLWSAGGWTAVTLTGAAFCVVGLAVWAAGRCGALVVDRPADTSRDAPRHGTQPAHLRQGADSALTESSLPPPTTPSPHHPFATSRKACT